MWLAANDQRFVAEKQAQIAQIQRLKTEQQAQIATALRLAYESSEVRDRQRSLLLAVEAVKTAEAAGVRVAAAQQSLIVASHALGGNGDHVKSGRGEKVA
jgi:hypothetical protein